MLEKQVMLLAGILPDLRIYPVRIGEPAAVVIVTSHGAPVFALCAGGKIGRFNDVIDALGMVRKWF